MSKDPLKDLYRLLDKQEFKSEKDLKNFLDSLLMKRIPEIKEEALTMEERAQDLVEEAYALPIRSAIKNIDIALNFNPDCIEAYEFMGHIQKRLDSSLAYYEKGVNIGKRIFGGNYLKMNKGHFWGLHETRPYMRCMWQYADCLYKSGRKDSCISVLEEMIELNQNDNQGVRDQLMLYLLEQNDFKKFGRYNRLFKEVGGAFMSFNRALFAFKKTGESDRSNLLLFTAIEENKFVLPMLISSKLQTELPDSFGYGDKSEAKYYSVFAQSIWQLTPGAVKWLKKHRHSQ